MNSSKLKDLKYQLLAIRANHEMNVIHDIYLSSVDDETIALIRKILEHNEAYNKQLTSTIIEILNAIEE